ncbi:hypothetical protein GCM10010466_46240 [Planomonospora alba]|uniref:Uncharacterized protein n=1 Tax=Planomonospora alba TaxID=161354 RepID=A0ABP6NJS7_9ACTN
MTGPVPRFGDVWTIKHSLVLPPEPRLIVSADDFNEEFHVVLTARIKDVDLPEDELTEPIRGYGAALLYMVEWLPRTSLHELVAAVPASRHELLGRRVRVPFGP